MLPIHNSRLAFDLLKPLFNSECEEFWLINLNSQLEPKNLILIAKGTLNYCPIHPRDLFREAIKANSFALIIAHNHPSLDTSPTPQDVVLTKKLFRLSKMLQIPILDHLIFTDQNYFSFKEHRLI